MEAQGGQRPAEAFAVSAQLLVPHLPTLLCNCVRAVSPDSVGKVQERPENVALLSRRLCPPTNDRIDQKSSESACPDHCRASRPATIAPTAAFPIGASAS